MSRFRVPFGDFDETEPFPDAFTPGSVLAKAAAKVETASGSREQGTRELDLSTPWGDLRVEARGTGTLLVETPEAEIPGPPVMRQAACQRLGIEPSLVDQAGTIDVVDVGRLVLVVPLPSPDAVRNAPATVELTGIPMVETELGITYATTQRSPYVKILARTWGGVDPLVALAAAARHLVTSKGFRPTYPRTRIVGQLVGQGEESCEVTVQAEKVSGQAQVTRVLVGGEVERVEKG